MKKSLSHTILALCATIAVSVATSRTHAASPNAGFDGTWESTWSHKESGTTDIESKIMTINGGHATEVETHTATLDTSNDDWAFLPAEFAQVSPLRAITRGESTAIKYRTGIMQITWGAPRLIDWSPKSIPRIFMEAEFKGTKASTATYQMRGNTLVDNTGLSWHRVSSSQRVPKRN